MTGPCLDHEDDPESCTSACDMTFRSNVTEPIAPPEPDEQDQIIAAFVALLRGPTGDGGTKREAGTKQHWTIDPGHRAAMYRHLHAWEQGERIDADSGCSPLVHFAWRALGLAWQETHEA